LIFPVTAGKNKNYFLSFFDIPKNNKTLPNPLQYKLYVQFKGASNVLQIYFKKLKSPDKLYLPKSIKFANKKSCF
jgi:hypothetical protein